MGTKIKFTCLCSNQLLNRKKVKCSTERVGFHLLLLPSSSLAFAQQDGEHGEDDLPGQLEQRDEAEQTHAEEERHGAADVGHQ